jgi:signal peptidase I
MKMDDKKSEKEIDDSILEAIIEETRLDSQQAELLDPELFDSEETEEPEQPEEVIAPAEKGEKRPGRIKSEIYEWAAMFLQTLIFTVVMFAFFARVIGVVGDSMNPTLKEADKVIVSNLFFTPTNGDVIVFRKQSFREEPLVKRVIATEGQTIDIDFVNGVVKVDGVVLKEDYVNALTHSALDFVGPQTVPKGMLFVMGDNRNNSSDSRDDRIGFIDTRTVIGKVWYVVMPISDFGRVH